MKIKSKKWIEREKLKEWRLKVLERDSYKCQICSSKSKKLHVHHIIPKFFIETRYDVMNGITLCFNHHKVGPHSPHMNVLWFFMWLQQNRIKQFEYLIAKIK